MAFAYYEYISYGADGEYDDESVSIKSIPFSFYVYKIPMAINMHITTVITIFLINSSFY